MVVVVDSATLLYLGPGAISSAAVVARLEINRQQLVTQRSPLLLSQFAPAHGRFSKSASTKANHRCITDNGNAAVKSSRTAYFFAVSASEEAGCVTATMRIAVCLARTTGCNAPA